MRRAARNETRDAILEKCEAQASRGKRRTYKLTVRCVEKERRKAQKTIAAALKNVKEGHGG